LSSFYNPRTSNEDGYVSFRKSLERVSRISNARILTAGDFNLPGIDWKQNCVKSGCPHATNHQYFLDTIQDFGLTQIVDTPTRGKNILDLVLTNQPSSVLRAEVLPGLSDHDVVFLELRVTPCKNTQKERKIPLYGKANWDNIRKDLQNTLREIKQIESQGKSVNETWNLFQSSLEISINKNIPTKLAKKKDQSPWISRDIKRLIKK